MSAASIPFIDRVILRYVSLSARRPFLVLLALIIVTGLLSLSVPRLSLEARIDALLPEGTVSQLSNDEATRRYAGTSPYFLVVESSDPEMNRKVSARVLEEVRKWPETIWAMSARDPEFFLDRRLLFLDEEPLAEFTADVDTYVRFRKCEKMPGCFQLDDEPEEPSFDALQEHLKSQPEVRSLSAVFGGDALDQAVSKGKTESKKKAGELCSPDGKICVVQATLNTEPTDLEFSRRMVAQGEALLTKLLPDNRPADTEVGVTGVYRNLPLARAELMDDLQRTFGLGILLMVGVIVLQFRRVRALVLLFLPLTLGSLWALGIFAWISPKLNLISAAGFIILAGLGIDFGLHLLTHYGAEREAGHSPEESVKATLLTLFSSLTVAGITTACGFLALTVAAFRGFAQLGLFATVGIFATLAAALLCFPPLVLGVQKLRPREGAFTRAWKMPGFLSTGFSRRWAVTITSIGVVAFALSLALLPRISLRYDLKPLIGKAESGIDYHAALGNTSRSAVLLLADDPESLEQAAAGIREKYPNGLSEPEREKGTTEVSGAPVITLGTFIPGDQDKKLEHIASLKKSAEEAMRFSDDDWKEKLRPWLPMLDVTQPLEQKDLPDWVMFSLRERDGTLGTVGLTYQDYPGSHAGLMLELSHKLDKLREAYPHVRFASSGAILGEVMPLLRQDGWRVTGLALAGLLIATSIIGRSRRRTILILSTILLAVAFSAALMVVFDWKIDFYNMLVFPVVFGIGVDGAIYVVWTVLKSKGEFDWEHLPVSARAVFGSTMTTWVMFVSLATSDNGGLSSLGTTGAAALFVSLVANLVWLPAALSWLQSRAESQNPPSKSESAPAEG